MIKYEYQVFAMARTPSTTAYDVADQLTNLGRNGWQLVWTNPGLDAMLMMRAVPGTPVVSPDGRVNLLDAVRPQDNGSPPRPAHSVPSGGPYRTGAPVPPVQPKD